MRMKNQFMTAASKKRSKAVKEFNLRKVEPNSMKDCGRMTNGTAKGRCTMNKQKQNTRVNSRMGSRVDKGLST